MSLGRPARYPASFAGWPFPRPVPPPEFSRQGFTRPVLRKLFLLRTFTPRPDDITRRWLLIDAEGAILGRMSTEIATLLRGKHKPIYAPHVDTGDFVVIINASKVALTGNKREAKLEYRHSGFPGGLTATPYKDLLERRPERAGASGPGSARSPSTRASGVVVSDSMASLALAASVTSPTV